MAGEFITKSELASVFSVSPPFITKLVKKGVFEGCFDKTGKKLYRELAIKAYTDAKDPSRENQRAANKRSKNEPVEEEIDEHTGEDIKNTPVYNSDNKAELKKLLDGVKMPGQKIQIIRDFWSAKVNEYKALQMSDVLIEKSMVEKQAFEIARMVRDSMMAIPGRVSQVIVSMKDKDEVEEYLKKEIYHALEALAK